MQSETHIFFFLPYHKTSKIYIYTYQITVSYHYYIKQVIIQIRHLGKYLGRAIYINLLKEEKNMAFSREQDSSYFVSVFVFNVKLK